MIVSNDAIIKACIFHYELEFILTLMSTMIEPLRIGNPILRQIARPVDPSELGTDDMQQLIQQMLETLRAYQGVGIAAPQIGVSKRVIIMEADRNPRYPGSGTVPLTILMNPELELLSDIREQGYEGCLSLGGMRGIVSWCPQVRYWGITPEGERLEREVTGFHARVIQHEIDHLNGRLIVDRVMDSRSFGFTEELKAANVIP